MKKNAGPNRNSITGFEVIDEIWKKRVLRLSCADIVALAARGSTVVVRPILN